MTPACQRGPSPLDLWRGIHYDIERFWALVDGLRGFLGPETYPDPGCGREPLPIARVDEGGAIKVVVPTVVAPDKCEVSGRVSGRTQRAAAMTRSVSTRRRMRDQP